MTTEFGLTQNSEWLTIFNTPSYTSSADLYTTQDVLISAYDLTSDAGFIARTDSNGNVIWNKQFYDSDWRNQIVTAFVVEDEKIAIYNKHANFLLLDSLALDTLDWGCLLPENFTSIESLSVKKANNKYLLYGIASNDSISANFYLLHDPNGNVICQEAIMNFMRPRNIIASLNSHNEALVSSVKSGLLINTKFDSLGHTLWIDTTKQWDVKVDDILLMSDSRLYIWGYKEKNTHPRNKRGYLGCYSSIDNSTIWEMDFSLNPGEDISVIEDVKVLPNGDIYYAGRVGVQSFGDVTNLQYGRIDRDGNLIFDRRKQISPMGDMVTALFPVDNQHIILVGTSNLSDQLITGKSFILKESISHSNVSTANNLQLPILFPNPAGSQLHLINAEKFFDLRYRILAFNGKTILFGKINSNYIDIEHVQPGHYIFQFENFTKNGQFKFIKL